MSLSLLPTKAANKLIMGKCRSTALESYKMQHPRLLTLYWHSVDALLMLCWRSVDGLLTVCWPSLSGEGTSTFTILPIKAANTSIMNKCHSAALGWYKMQHTKSLMLCWRSFSDWGCDQVAFSFAHKGCHYLSLWVNAVAQSLNHIRCNTQDCWPSVDALLMLCWRSVDALLTLCWCSLSGEATSTLTILPIKATHTLIMDKSRSTALGWHKMQHTKLLTLCWRSFSDWGCDHVAFSFAYKGWQYVDYG